MGSEHQCTSSTQEEEQVLVNLVNKEVEEKSQPGRNQLLVPG